jgi:hypothetical protein
VFEHLTSLDLEAFAELDVSPADDLLQFGLPPDQRLLPDILAVQLEQVERDEDDGFGRSFELVL